MTYFSDDEALDREHNQMMGVTCLVYAIGGLFFLITLSLILNMIDESAIIGWIVFIIWFAAVFYSIRAADNGYGPFRLLDQWEQSILRRRTYQEQLAALRAGERLYNMDCNGCMQELEERDGVIVRKTPHNDNG